MSSGNTAIVTGASSMLGVNLIEELLKQNTTTIYAIVRPSSRKALHIPRSDFVRIIECEINNYQVLPSIIDADDGTFFHLAWQSNGSAKERNTNIRAQAENIAFSIDALHAASSMGCTSFVGIGSQAEYGLQNLSKISPDTPCNPIQPYGIAKFAAGKLILEESKALGIDCAWVRVFSVYGPHDRDTSLISTLIDTLRTGKTPEMTAGQQKWDYLYERDAGEAIALIGKYINGRKIYCLGYGESQSIADYAKIVNQLVNPDVAIKLGAIPYPTNAVMNICADISSLTNDTGWKPKTDFTTGIEQTIAIKIG